jgi:gamma-butyrobetaine dioxygenase
LDKPKPSSNAYTSLELLPHTDLPHHTDPPGIQLLHCIANTVTGGETVIVDGFQIASRIRECDPDKFRRLATTPITFSYQSAQSEHSWQGPVIMLNCEDEITHLRLAPNVTAPFAVPFDTFLQYREAYRSLLAMTRDRQNQLRFRLKPGDLLIADNFRTLHGRTAYDARSGVRHLQGCYLDYSEFLASARRYEKQLAGRQ